MNTVLYYKGAYIYGYTSRRGVHVQLLTTGGYSINQTVKSLHAAKLLITKYHKGA